MAVEIARAAKEAVSGQTARNSSLEFDEVCFALKRKSFGENGASFKYSVAADLRVAI